MSNYKRFNPSNDDRVDDIKAGYEAFCTAIALNSPDGPAKDKALCDALSASMFAVKACFGGIPTGNTE